MVACSSVHPEIRMPGNACYDLFNEIISILGYMASNDMIRVNNELKRM
jgi:hypothetical protein